MKFEYYFIYRKGRLYVTDGVREQLFLRSCKQQRWEGWDIKCYNDLILFLIGCEEFESVSIDFIIGDLREIIAGLMQYKKSIKNVEQLVDIYTNTYI